ncbi:MAG: bifunctional 5,10-methylenetetrahydrofolate dehydrogenase/5,10-methenyltetrahydrofolate cyclohydrolase [Bacteroidales bacterium]
MTDKIIDGKVISAEMKNEIAARVAEMIDANIEPPHLAALIVGDDPASQTYVASKERSCHQVGITSSVYRLPETATEEEVLAMVDFLNADPDVDGFIVQLPVPKHINSDKIIERISPKKDVDGFHPYNLGMMQLGLPTFLPATPFGIVEMLKRSKVEVAGKHVVVLGRSNIVGTPISILLSRKSAAGNATVTLCHSLTQNLEEITRQADILIAAIGIPHFVKASMVKKGAVVVDVGIHRIEDTTCEKGYYITGDVDFKEVEPIAGRITPVPGGVGLMTVVALLHNTLLAAEKRNS